MVYITGDLHGDYNRLDSIKLKKGDTLIICGDFGLVWDGSAREEKLLRQLGKKKFNICFLDGTHENFELLDEYPVGVFCGGRSPAGKKPYKKRKIYNRNSFYLRSYLLL